MDRFDWDEMRFFPRDRARTERLAAAAQVSAKMSRAYHRMKRTSGPAKPLVNELVER